MIVIYLKLIIGLALGFISALLWVKRKIIKSLLEHANTYTILGSAWVICRLIPFVFIYFIFGFEPQSDVQGFWEEASMAYHGKIVYRDFWSPYSPLYPYLLAFWLNLWYNPKIIVLAMAIMEGLALLLSIQFYKGSQTKSELLWRLLVYLTLPGSLMLCVVGGQEDVWMWMMVLIAIFVRTQTANIWLFSLLLAIGLLITKAIFLLVIIPLFWIEKDKLKFATPLAVVGIITLSVLFHIVGWEFMQPLDEAKVLRAPNLLSVLNPLSFDSIGIGSRIWNWAALVFTLVLGIITLQRIKSKTVENQLPHFWVVVFATMMILQQSAYSNYIFLFLIPLTFSIIDWENRNQVVCFLFYNFLCVIHPSWWWRAGMPVYKDIASVLDDWRYTVDYGMQVGIVVLTIYFIRLAFPTAIVHSLAVEKEESVLL